MEVWKEVVGFETIYWVSSLGRIKNSKGEIPKHQIQNSGYSLVHLCKDKKRRALTIHRLVAIAFLDNPDNKPQVNHKDRNKQNNSVDNLEWSSRSENMIHASQTGAFEKRKEGAKLRMSKIGRQYSKANSNRLSTYPRNEKGWIIKPKSL